MDVYDNHYTSYRNYQDGLFSPAGARKCPYCRHRLPECDCGYGLLELDAQKPVARHGARKIFDLLNRAGKRLFTARGHQGLLQPR